MYFQQIWRQYGINERKDRKSQEISGNYKKEQSRNFRTEKYNCNEKNHYGECNDLNSRFVIEKKVSMILKLE